MSFPRRRFVDWCARRLLTAGEEPRSFALYHVQRTGTAALVAKLALCGDGADDVAAHVAELAEKEAQDHAAGFAGRQQYAIRAYGAGTPESGAPELGEFPFRYAHSSIGVQTDAATELLGPMPEPSARAAVTDMATVQLMRHNEGLVRLLVEVTSQKGERDAEIIRAQQAQIDRLTQRQLTSYELVERLLSEERERELKERAWDADEARKDKLMARLEEIFFPAVQKRFGIPMPGAGGGGVLDEIRELFISLPDATQSAVLDALPDDKAHRLLDLLNESLHGADQGSVH